MYLSQPLIQTVKGQSSVTERQRDKAGGIPGDYRTLPSTNFPRGHGQKAFVMHDGLIFDSKFESGNMGSVVEIRAKDD